MTGAEPVGVRPFGLTRVVICLQGSGGIAVDRLYFLVIDLSVCGFASARACVCFHALAVPRVPASLYPDYLKPNQSAAPQSLPRPGGAFTADFL